MDAPDEGRHPPETLERYAEMHKKLSENGARATVGAASVIAADEDLYGLVLNPLGVQDATQVELTDVPGEHPCYEVVRYVFERGYMAPLTEEAFGVDEAATTGDLLTALYVMIGGQAGAEEARAFFAGYGMTTEDVDLYEGVTAADAAATMSTLATLMELEWSEKPPPMRPCPAATWRDADAL